MYAEGAVLKTVVQDRLLRFGPSNYYINNKLIVYHTMVTGLGHKQLSSSDHAIMIIRP